MPRRTWADRVVSTPRTFTVQNNADGTITLVPSPGTVVQAGTPVNATNLNGIEQDLVNTMLLTDNIQGTTTAPTISNGQVTRVDHMSGTTTIRTDVFTYATNLITEVRTLVATNDVITLKYHLDTLQVGVI